MKKDNLGYDTQHKCGALILDESQEYFILVFENSYPVRTRKWGVPKGSLKSSETKENCVLREVWEEIGIDIGQFPHRIRRIDIKHQVIVIDKHHRDVILTPGPEVRYAVWKPVSRVMKDVELRPQLYNRTIRTWFKTSLLALAARTANS